MLVLFILCMLVFGTSFVLLSAMGLFALLFNTMVPLDFITVLTVFGVGVVLLCVGFGTMLIISSKDYYNSKKVVK